jgi:hypothetical protein
MRLTVNRAPEKVLAPKTPKTPKVPKTSVFPAVFGGLS